MNEINFMWCLALCALAIWIEAMRSVRMMRKQAEKLHARYENYRLGNEQDMHGNQMEQASAWPELLATNELKSGGSVVLEGRESKPEIALNSPWLYLSLVLLLALLLL
jgi:hypothetical protein